MTIFCRANMRVLRVHSTSILQYPTPCFYSYYYFVHSVRIHEPHQLCISQAESIRATSCSSSDTEPEMYNRLPSKTVSAYKDCNIYKKMVGIQTCGDFVLVPKQNSVTNEQNTFEVGAKRKKHSKHDVTLSHLQRCIGEGEML